MTVVEQVRADPAAAPVSAELKALLEIAAATRDSGHAVTAEHIARARAAGATDVEIHDTVLIAAVFCMFNRYVDGLATTTPNDPAAYAAGAQQLITHGYPPPSADAATTSDTTALLAGSPSGRCWTLGSPGDEFARSGQS